MAILAAGVGFAIRGGIFDNWAKEFGFTGEQLGKIGGYGFSGFCFGIIIGGVICDIIGYGKLVVVAFALHVLSAVVTFTASGSADQAYTRLLIGMFLFAFANGTLEAVANPLVATLYPENRTHYLNILHASWPAGMVLGVCAGWLLDDKLQIHWKYQLALYLIPTVIYGIMFMGQHFPKSEASAKGMKLGDMLKDVGLLGSSIACALIAIFFGGFLEPFIGPSATYIGIGVGVALWVAVGVLTGFSLGSVLLFVLFFAHLLIGSVELGTDGWIQNITGNLFSSEIGKYLFLWTSAIMFGLRFCAHFIETKLGLSPIGLLLVCSILAVVGLQMASGMTSVGVAFAALGIYAVGKTFFWPTMLAVASDRFPRTGAVAISVMGGIGMLSVGILGSPGLGYAKDRFAGEALKQKDPALFDKYKADKPSKFIGLEVSAATGLDGKKLGEAKDAKPAAEITPEMNPKPAVRTPEQQLVVEADQAGDRMTLKADSAIPAVMAVIYLLLLLYFKAKGGYRRVSIDEVPA